MSTETSDKNVATEEDIKILENYLKNSAYKQSNSDFFKNGGWEIVDLEVPQALEHLLLDYTRQKQINKEHQKINRELIEKTNELEKNLEKQKKLTTLAETITDESIKEALIEFEKDYIPKQKIKNKILELEQEDLKIYDTDSEDLIIAKYEQRAILNTLKELLK